MLPITIFDHYPRVGIANSAYTPMFLNQYPDAVDYIEVPFEQLCHDPSVLEKISHFKPSVLHCSSLSIAGSILPSEETVDAIHHWIEKTQTPWLGEHLSFIVAERKQACDFAEEHYPGEPYN